MNIMVDYVLAKECKNPDAWYMCHKCGKCGRKFEDGLMVDDGGTHPQEDWEDEIGECVVVNEFVEEEDGERTYITHWMPLPEPPKEDA